MKTRVENGLRKVLIFGLFLLSFAKSAVSQRQNGFSFEYGADESSTDQFELRPNCPPGQKLVEKPEGYICMEDIRRNRYQIQGNGPSQNPQLHYSEVNLPNEIDVFTSDEQRCFSQERVYWPPDSNCYPLLQQGPCRIGEWLVVSETISSRPNYNAAVQRQNLKVSCKIRPCPCLDRDPDFCEVLVKQPTSSRNRPLYGCKNCIAALAAEQDDICGQGEQLYNTPLGFGICGCRIKPQLHIRLSGTCYPLHSQGPCTDNHTLHWSPSLNQPLCVPLICPVGRVLSILDGQCHFLGAQGPCENSEDVFQINPDTRQVSCVPKMAAKPKRIFDVLPSNMRHNGGSLEGSEGGFGANMLNCLSGSNKCSAGRLGRGRISTIADPRMGKRVLENDSRKMAAQYIKWIRSFIDQA